MSKGRWKTVYFVNSDDRVISRECRQCLEIKLIEEFYPSTTGFEGRKAVCSDCEKADNRQYHRSDKTRTAARRAKYVSKNRDRVNATTRAWIARNREKVNKRRSMYATNTNRSARDFGLPAEFTVRDKEELLKIFGGCALTGEKENIHFDHVLPVSLGVGGSVKWNILPLKAGLNISKGNKNFFEWFKQNKNRFNLDDHKFQRSIEYLAKQKGVTVDEYEKFVYDCYYVKSNEEERG